MFYLKINEKIRALLDQCKNIKLGCRDYCKYQLIALDELELLRIELTNGNIQSLSSEEFTDLKNSTEKVYFHSTHVCIHDNKMPKEKIAEQIQKEELEDLQADAEAEKNSINNFNFSKNTNKDSENAYQDFLKSDSIKERKKADVIAKFRVTYDFVDEKENEGKNLSNGISIKETENTLSYGVSMIVSFFLLVLGSFYFGRDYLMWSPANTLKLTLVVTIIVFFAEAFLLIIKLSKQDDALKNHKAASDRIKKYSLAYQLDEKYRNSFLNPNNYKKKVGDSSDNKAKKE